MDYLTVYFSCARLELCDQTEVNRREQRGREIGLLIEVGRGEMVGGKGLVGALITKASRAEQRESLSLSRLVFLLFRERRVKLLWSSRALPGEIIKENQSDDANLHNTTPSLLWRV